MGRKLWPPLYRLIRETAKQFSQKYVQLGRRLDCGWNISYNRAL